MVKYVQLERKFADQDGHYRLDSAGFLYEPMLPFGRRTAMLPAGPEFDLGDLREHPCVVLLGEPGIGKTASLAQMPQPTVDRRLDFNLAHFGSETRFVNELLAHEVIRDWTDSEEVLLLTLDSLDEAVAEIPKLVGILCARLANWPLERLRLRIGCRTANWPRQLGERLVEAGMHVKVAELLPLTRSDVERFVSAELGDADGFTNDITSRSLGALAARPLTLGLLLTLYKRGPLPNSLADLYDQALELMLREQNPSRKEATSARDLTTSDRKELACWLAAATVFCGANSFTADPSAADDSVLSTDLARSALRRLAINRSHGDIMAVLDSGVFSGAGAGRLGWSHRSFAEYLAAQHLVAAFSAEQIRNLVVRQIGNRVVVPPGMRQVVGWVSAIRPESVAPLVTDDPGAFVIARVESSNDELKQAVVRNLFEAARLGEYRDTFAENYRHLTHGALDSQLRPVLVEPSSVLAERDLALTIAQDCNAVDLALVIRDLALDGSMDLRSRIKAVYAVESLSGELLPGLQILATRRADGDALFELGSAALSALWPSHLEPLQLLEILSVVDIPKKGTSYESFCRSVNLPELGADLDGAVQWAEKLVQHATRGHPFEHIAVQILQQLIDSLEANDDMLSRSAKLFIHLSGDYRPAELRSDAGGDLLDLAVDTRLGLLEAISAEVKDDNEFFEVLDVPNTHGSALVGPSDFPLLLRRYERAGPSADEIRRIAYVAESIFVASDDEHARLVFEHGEQHPLLALRFGWCFRSVQLDSDEAARGRRRTQAAVIPEEEEPTEQDSPLELTRQITEQLDEVEAGNLLALHRAQNLVFEGTVDSRDPYWATILDSKTWSALDELLRARFVTASLRYLDVASSGTGGWFEAHRYSAADWTAYRALTLLHDVHEEQPRSLSVASWRRWAQAVVAGPATGDSRAAELKRELVGTALALVPEAMMEIGIQIIESARAEGQSLHHIRTVEQIWSPGLAAHVFEVINDPELPGETFNSLVQVISAAQELSRLLPYLEANSGDSHNDRAATIAREVLVNGNSSCGPGLVSFFVRNPRVGRQLAVRHANHSWNRVPSFEVADLGRLVDYLFDEFTSEGAGETGSPAMPDQVAWWQSRILGAIAGAVEGGAGLCELERMATARPGDRLLIEPEIRRARELLAEQSTSLISFEELVSLAESGGTLVVHDSAALRLSVVRGLGRIQAQLLNDTPDSQFLWNTSSVRRPKSEDEVSDWVRNRLVEDFAGRAVVNREVQVLRTAPSGIPQRSDIRVEVSGSHRIPPVIVEAKVHWADDVVTSLAEQLWERYMSRIPTSDGVFLVYYFGPESWDPADANRAKAASIALPDLRERLLAEAEKLFPDVRIDVFVLDCSYPSRR